MQNTLSSLALVQYYYEKNNDIIKAFEPLMIYMLSRQRNTEFTLKELSDLFSKEYGINLPIHPLETILKRLRPKYIERHSGKIHVFQKAVENDAADLRYKEERKNLDLLLNDFVTYCAKFMVPVEVTKAEAESLFNEFLQSHDSDVLFAIDNGNCSSIFDCDDSSFNQDKVFLINRYINEQLTKNMSHASFIVKAALGHLFSSTFFYRDFLSIPGDAVCDNCYLDTNLLFDLFGINGNYRSESIQQFVKELTSAGTAVKIFGHNYKEFLKIIENCLQYIESTNFDFQKASRSLLYFRYSNFSKCNIETFIGSIPSKLRNFGIEVVEGPTPNSSIEYQIDSLKLKNCILEAYNANSQEQIFDLEQRQTLEIDIKSIESIYKLRRGKTPLNLGETSDVLVTSNTGLARASMYFQRRDQGNNFFSIPPVITDIFLGTMVWLQKPSKIAEDYSKSKMIAYTNAIIEPDISLLSKLSTEIDNALENPNNPLSQENARILLETNFSRQMLADTTLNDDDRITEDTPYDLMRVLEKSITARHLLEIEELKADLESNKQASNKAEETINKQLGDIEQHNTKVRNRIQGIAKKVINVILASSLVIILVVITLYFFDKIPPKLSKFIVFICTLSGLSFFGIFALGKKLEEVIIRWLESWFILETDPKQPNDDLKESQQKMIGNKPTSLDSKSHEKRQSTGHCVLIVVAIISAVATIGAAIFGNIHEIVKLFLPKPDPNTIVTITESTPAVEAAWKITDDCLPSLSDPREESGYWNTFPTETRPENECINKNDLIGLTIYENGFSIRNAGTSIQNVGTQHFIFKGLSFEVPPDTKRISFNLEIDKLDFGMYSPRVFLGIGNPTQSKNVVSGKYLVFYTLEQEDHFFSDVLEAPLDTVGEFSKVDSKTTRIVIDFSTPGSLTMIKNGKPINGLTQIPYTGDKFVIGYYFDRAAAIDFSIRDFQIE